MLFNPNDVILCAFQIYQNLFVFEVIPCYSFEYFGEDIQLFEALSHYRFPRSLQWRRQKYGQFYFICEYLSGKEGTEDI